MSEEQGGKMTLGQKVRMGFLILVVAYALVLAAINWDGVDVRFLPGHPVKIPLILVCLLTFGLGSAVTFVWISFRTLRRKKEEQPASLPPAAPPAP